MYCCLESEQQIDLQGLRLTDHFEMEIISDYVKITTNTLFTELTLSNKAITDEGLNELYSKSH